MGEEANALLAALRVVEEREAKRATVQATLPNHLALRNARNRLEKHRKRHEALEGRIEEAEAALAALKKEHGESCVQNDVLEAEVAQLEAKAASDTVQAAAQGRAGSANSLAVSGCVAQHSQGDPREPLRPARASPSAAVLC